MRHVLGYSLDCSSPPGRPGVTMRVGLLLCALAMLLGPATATAAKRAPKLPKAAEAMKRSLAKPVLSGTFIQALMRFQNLAQVRVGVEWSAVEAAGVRKTDKVTVKVPSATAEQLLDILLARVSRKGRPLAWYIDGELIAITTQMRVLHRRSFPIVAVTERTSAVPPKRAAAAVAAARAGKMVELSFDETPLEEVVSFVRAKGLNIFVNWRSLDPLGVTRSSPITLKAKNISLVEMLTMVTEQLSTQRDTLSRVYWVVDEGIIRVGSGEALNRKLQTQIFDVGDLLMAVPHFPGDGLSLSDSWSDDDDDDDDDDAESAGAQRNLLRENLISIIRNLIGEDMWQPLGKGSIHLMNNRLIITQTQLGFKLLDQAGGRVAR